MLTIAFITGLAVYVSMINGTVEDVTQTTYDVTGRSDLRTPYFKDGDIVTGQQIVDFINMDSRNADVVIPTTITKGTSSEIYPIGSTYSGHTLNTTKRYKVTITNISGDVTGKYQYNIANV